MKKIIAVALALILALSVCAVLGFAADGTTTTTAPAAAGIDYAKLISQLLELVKKVDWQSIINNLVKVIQQVMAILSSATGK